MRLLSVFFALPFIAITFNSAFAQQAATQEMRAKYPGSKLARYINSDPERFETTKEFSSLFGVFVDAELVKLRALHKGNPNDTKFRGNGYEVKALMGCQDAVRLFPDVTSPDRMTALAALEFSSAHSLCSRGLSSIAPFLNAGDSTRYAAYTAWNEVSRLVERPSLPNRRELMKTYDEAKDTRYEAEFAAAPAVAAAPRPEAPAVSKAAATPPAVADNSPATVRQRQQFASGPLNQYIEADTARFAAIQKFVADMGTHVDARIDEFSSLAQQTPNASAFSNDGFGVKPYFACKDASSLFNEVTSASRITESAVQRYVLAFNACRTAMPRMADFIKAEPTRNATFMEWQQLSNTIRPQQQIDRSMPGIYSRDLDQRYAALFEGASKAPSVIDPPLPSEPYQFNFEEFAAIKQHVLAVLKVADPEGKQVNRLPNCVNILKTQQSAFVVFHTVNTWLDLCGNQLAIIGAAPHGLPLREWVQDYHEKLVKHERQAQQASLGKMPPLPMRPFAYHLNEVQAIRQYMAAARAQSLALIATVQRPGADGKIMETQNCERAQPLKMDGDISNPFVRDNWLSYVRNLKGCAETVAEHNPPAGLPLLDQLTFYLDDLVKKQSQPLFR